MIKAKLIFLTVVLPLFATAFADTQWFFDKTSGVEFVFIKGGCFEMGRENGKEDEKPAHKVCVDDFFMGRFEVTQAQWQNITGTNRSFFNGCGNCPVENITMGGIKQYLSVLNSRTGRVYRLPTEAEWEYAAVIGKTVTCEPKEKPKHAAWYNGNSDGSIRPVGTKSPNDIGLYDMAGNVWEWVADVYSATAYSSHEENNPIHKGEGKYGVMRGGSWDNSAEKTCPQFRQPAQMNYGDATRGFRLVMNVK